MHSFKHFNDYNDEISKLIRVLKHDLFISNEMALLHLLNEMNSIFKIEWLTQ